MVRNRLLLVALFLCGCPDKEAPRPGSAGPVAGARSVPSDLAHVPDLAPPQKPPLTWHMKACKNAPGCTENGVSHTCKELGIRGLRFTVTDERTHAETTTHATCPAEQSDGEVAIQVPTGTGPWSLKATTDDKPSARSEIVCHITPRCWERGFSVNVYALGCTDPECVVCVEGNHPVGWCQ